MDFHKKWNSCLEQLKELVDYYSYQIKASKKLLKNLDIEKIIGNADLEIKNIQTDSNSVGKQSLFVCLSGGRFDGHNFAKVAQKYGACAVVCEKDLDLAVTQIIVKNSRVALGIIASNFYGNVTSDMKLIGVVGTNGKTTTVCMIESILKSGAEKQTLNDEQKEYIKKTPERNCSGVLNLKFCYAKF